ncbi:hypothetical protein TEHD10_0615 [Tetragenococcus halophilus subsp. halophilus]|uniref:Uncharacterized protein n=1 Tax=Tetragenococcus halophilus (strain DSM 20338 / JCM 20259 / NCIMB 9735 / NBRC 12172) TaxID=945021 RepID=A0AAN1SH92_TETHN|nr:hypothetical protein TEH_16610 [Tetragenococcus halophilus NBRC 12172]GBD70855.1 putative uncharacterized protein [Tetragenococcus halophilus subsp. halophilus]GBD73469.1 putative uncharacterized protein [Tetragenococcus halophilus subsp. halophilus]GBD79552.1 hypothetical protein TEHD10_0615 [Tetragenococcus halophilus subsp. halophilus]
MEERTMTEEENQLFTEVFKSGFELDGLVQNLDFLTFERFPGTSITMKDIEALHGLTAAFSVLSKKHIKDITTLNELH